MHVFDEVLLSGLANGHNGIGYAAGMALLNAVGKTVEGAVVLWVAPDDEVVHGYDAFDAVGNAMRQFVAETVENVHLVGLEMHGDAMAAPKIGKVAVEARGFPCGNIGIAGKIVAVVA